MKRLTGFISVVMILSMVLALMAPCAAAASSASTVVQYGKREKLDEPDQWGNDYYGGYLAIGDSVSRGCGATASNNDWNVGYSDYYDYLNALVENSSPTLLQEDLGCQLVGGPTKIDETWGEVPYRVNGFVLPNAEDENGNYIGGSFWPIAFPGQPITAAMDLFAIDDGYEWETNYLNVSKGYTLDYASYLYPNARDLLRTASLITIEQGLCDTFYRTLMASIAEIYTLIAGEVCAEDITAFADVMLTNLYDSYNEWKNAYPLLLKTIKEENPNATVVIVGNFNPLANVTLTEDSWLPLGQAYALITAQMNADCIAWAKEFNYAYADIQNVETPMTQYGYAITGQELSGWLTGGGNLDDALIDIMVATHPTPEGHTYIYRQILKVLPEVEGSAPVVDCDPVEKVPTVINFMGKEIALPDSVVNNVKKLVNPNTAITLDLGRFNKVSYVMVDKKIVKNWSFSNPDNEYEITIPYNRKDAKILTIVVVQEDGKVAVYTYQLAYDAEQGYIVYRIYNTNDAVSTVSKVGSTIVNVFNKIVSFFKKSA